ncbi:hypothetical protein [uncultured Winogradskyella sp.]|uniref:hypothetical protein n=1 Tax=uncultured Winogradskyella sp. TaxID=395353 RepID=UPI002630235B|nr:hypothetical protein [uncultured Winogradskyella sp.]
MKNNVLSAFVVFFAVVACLLIIDDISHGMSASKTDSSEISNEIEQSNTETLATLDLETED